MNSVEKDTLVQKAICCSGNYAKEVADDFISGKICANSKFKKLAMLISYIEALDCYRAPLEETTYITTPTTPVLAQFTITLPCSVWDSVLNVSSSASVTINGDETDISGDGVSTFGSLILTMLSDIVGIVITIGECINSNIIIDITYLCNTASIVFTNSTVIGAPPILISTSYTGVNTVIGSCLSYTLTGITTTTEYTNCLTEDQADNIANQIALICDSCDEH